MTRSIIIVLLECLCIYMISCKNNPPLQHKNPTEIKTDSAILLIYKIYSGCRTTILEKEGSKIDTLIKDISYLCLPVKIFNTEVFSDTTLITIFFEPEQGYAVETYDFAYSIGFIGVDHASDFIMFGDNYYTMSVKAYFEENKKIDSIFQRNVRTEKCINSRLKGIIKL